MTTFHLENLFGAQRSWLENQPGMTPWQEGTRMLSHQIDAWLADYSPPFCDRPVTPARDTYPRYAERLWECWSHHWQQALLESPDRRTDGQTVASRIASGHGYVRGGQLGGNPFRDVVLAQAVLERENRGTEVFCKEYFPFAQRLAARCHARFGNSPDEWWNDFLDHLAGYTRSPRLARFTGKCALQNWLGTVLWNFLRDRRFPEGVNGDWMEEAIPDRRVAEHDPARSECLSLFTHLVEHSLDQLDKGDQLVLYLLFVDQLKLRDVASIVGKHAGNVGKQRDRAIERLYELVMVSVAQAKRQRAYRECMQYVADVPADFARSLCDALKRSCESVGQIASLSEDGQHGIIPREEEDA